jgi:flagellar export protein FliJ
VKKFNFGLQTVLDWRDRRAEQERNALECLHAKRNELERERSELSEQMASSHAAYAVTDSGSSEDLRHLAGFLEALRSREDRVRKNVAQCRANIGTQTGRCLEADRDHRLLVRLRERQFAGWRYELNRETEANVADSWMAGRVRETARTRSDEAP